MSNQPASIPAPLARGPRRDDASIPWKVVTLLLGLAVGTLAVVAVALVQVADDARDEARGAGAPGTAAIGGHSTHDATANQALPLQSFAGKTAADAEAIAKTHAATNAVLPPVPAGDLVVCRTCGNHHPPRRK